MRISKYLSAVCAVLLLTCGTAPELTGTGSETDTAMIYNPDNTPAVGAVVRFFVATDSTRAIAYQTTTDTNGHYSTKRLVKGTYNMLAYSAKGFASGAPKMLAADDSLIAYQNSIVVLSDTVLVNPDTLEKPGSITGIIGLQPNHDPRTVTVQVLGTDLYSNVDANGRFTLSPVARGSYNLRLVTTLTDYTPTYKTIQTAGQKMDTLSDTLWLLYTGIPVVTGLAATYDTVNGVVHLSWNKASYRDFQDYLIFRDDYNSMVLSAIPIAALGDTFFVDTVFKRNLVNGQFSFIDTNDYHFKYRVCVENSSSKRGDAYRYVDIIAASPVKAATTFAFTFYHIAKQFMTDSASVNDSVRCSLKLSNPTRQLRSLVWTDIATGKTVRTNSFDSTKMAASDSLVYAWNSVGEKKLECVVTDMAGTVWRDTARISIVKDAPVVNMTYSPASIAVNDTIHIHVTATRKYGTIVKVEWDIGNTGVFSWGMMKDSVADTVVVAPGVPDTGYGCVVRVTDDDGYVVTNIVTLKVNLFILATGAGAFPARWGHASVVFNNVMWIIGGYYHGPVGVPHATTLGDLWYSSDGNIWTQATASPAFPNRGGCSSLVFNGKMWVIGGNDIAGPATSSLNDIWYSSDGITWIEATTSAAFSPRTGHSSLAFSGKMWVIGGNDSVNGLGWLGNGYKNDVWYSSDGISWSQATSSAAFSPRCNHTSLVFDNKMWVVGGAGIGMATNRDVWYSTDGITWTQATASAAFSARYYHSSAVFNGKMWVIGGQDGTGTRNDIWYSTDGSAWTQLSSFTGFSPRYGQSSLVFNNELWSIGGTGDTDYKDVWYMK